MKKKILFIGVFVLIIISGIIYSGDLVTAATKVTVKVDDPKVRVCYDKNGTYINTKTGNSKCDTGYGDVIKYIDDDYAYCVNWKLKFIDHYGYILDESWKKDSKNAIMAGYIIDSVNKKGYSYDKAYARTGATLNTLFATIVKDASSTGSNDFSKDTEVAGYIEGANKYYNNTVKLGNKTPDVKIEVSGDTLNYKGTNGTDGYYYSNKITLSGFVKTYGGASDSVNYTITAKTKDGVEVDICTDDKRQSCSKNITFKDVEANQIYYLFVDANKVDSTDVITLNVSSNNKSTYFSSLLYKDEANEEAQKVIRKISFDVERNNSKSYTFTIPNLVGHQISAYKVDEDGKEICGATLEIYRDDPKGENASNMIASNHNDNDRCRITYKTDSTTEGNDDFFNHDYYLIERSAPDGFVLVDSVKHFYKKNSGDKLSLTCVGNDGEEVDPEYCYPENYSFMCVNNNDSTIIVAPDSNGNCPTSSTGTTGPTLNGEGEGNTGTEITPNATPEGGVELDALYKKVCYNVKDPNKLEEAKDASYCNSDGNYTKIWTGYGNMTVRQLNVRNVVNISKVDVTNKKEVIGAHLKVCTKASYEEKGNECDAGLTVDGIKMEWTSDDVPYSIYGIKKGEYYIVEEIPPKGYLKATTAVKFSIDEYGKVTTDNKTITNDDFVNKGAVIVIDNNLTEITISKQDIATKKELPGATLSICQSYRDNETDELQMKVDQYTGDCIEAVLADGTTATWKSTNEAKKIRGLEPGTYYLVERIAPTDYTLAESIIFTLKEDGTLVDKDGKSLDNNKIEMFDTPLENKKTGSLDIYVITGIGLGVIVLGLGTYYYLNKTKINDVVVKKIRKRKIHNKVDKD